MSIEAPKRVDSIDLFNAIFEELRGRGLHVVGLFRQAINVTETRKLYGEVCTEGLHKLKEQEEPHQLAALVIWHLKHLPEPLFPYNLYELVVSIGGMEDDSEGIQTPVSNDDQLNLSGGWSMQKDTEEEGKWGGSNSGTNSVSGGITGEVGLKQLRNLVAQLPHARWELLKILLEFLAQVVAVSTSPDTQRALAQIFAPVLCRPPGSAFMSLRHVQDLVRIHRVVLGMFQCHTALSSTRSLREKALMTPRKDGLPGSGSALYRRQSSSADLSIIQKLICDSVSLLFSEASDDDDDIEEQDFDQAGGERRTRKPRVSRLLRLPGAFDSRYVERQILQVQRSSSFFESDDDNLGGMNLDTPSSSQGPTFPVSPTEKEDNGVLRGMSIASSWGNQRDVHERRRMLHACKALRAQIKKFEEKFVADHGRLPRGLERAPVASTQQQYKEWKKFIRSDAATHIQAIARGRAVRRRYSEIWDKIRKKRQTSLDAVADAYMPMPYPPPAAGPAQSDKAAAREKLTQWTEDKRRIKEKLKDFDMDFFDKHGRAPTKVEKEPMRSLYDQYNVLKNRIREQEKIISSQSASPPPVQYSSRAGNGPRSPARGTGASAASHSHTHSQPEAHTHTHHAHVHTHSHSDSSGKGVRGEEIEKLKKEKHDLHLFLKEYEVDFKEKHGRDVDSTSDIVAIAAEYQRYKEVKRRLSRLAKADNPNPHASKEQKK